MFKMCAHDNIENSLEFIRLYAMIPTRNILNPYPLLPTY